MVRRLHVALAVAACCGLGAPAHADPAWPRDPELERALGRTAGAVVAVDPRDGRILAFAGGRERLREAAPPGSLAKLVTAYAALRAGRTDGARRIACTGRFAGHACARAHGALTLEEALAQSCNVHFMKLGTEAGAPALVAAAREFGFGRPTGADPREATGRVVEPVGAEWTADLACGVGAAFTATPLQIVRAAAAISNGGDVLALHLSGGQRQVVASLDPVPLAILRAGMRSATRGPGTAGALGALRISVAGKTGTAIFEAGDPPRWYGHFAGYAPADAPAVALAVRTEGRSAARDAVPVAAAAFRLLLPGGSAVPPSRHAAADVRVRL
ncbi:MAG: hypothetical protein FJZ01_20310, partial [Candidatus Sericytochromatia bacterium]|nr:hypothetical protein [Candidatus Tanganyikabacteria bacterium]